MMDAFMKYRLTPDDIRLAVGALGGSLPDLDVTCTGADIQHELDGVAEEMEEADAGYQDYDDDALPISPGVALQAGMIRRLAEKVSGLPPVPATALRGYILGIQHGIALARQSMR